MAVPLLIAIKKMRHIYFVVVFGMNFQFPVLGQGGLCSFRADEKNFNFSSQLNAHHVALHPIVYQNQSFYVTLDFHNP